MRFDPKYSGDRLPRGELVLHVFGLVCILYIIIEYCSFQSSYLYNYNQPGSYRFQRGETPGLFLPLSDFVFDPPRLPPSVRAEYSVYSGVFFIVRRVHLTLSVVNPESECCLLTHEK